MKMNNIKALDHEWYPIGFQNNSHFRLLREKKRSWDKEIILFVSKKEFLITEKVFIGAFGHYVLSILGVYLWKQFYQ